MSVIPRVNDWAWRHEEDIRFTFHGSLAILLAMLAFIGTYSVVTPAQATMTTSHQIYLPPNVQIADGLTNQFVQGVTFGGAGGIAQTQIELTLEKYEFNENQTTDHWLVISQEEGSSGCGCGSESYVNYYAILPSSLLHSKIRLETPTWGRWGLAFGGYQPRPFGASIKEGQLVVDRDFSLNGTAAILMFVFAIVGIAVYVSGIRPFLNRLIVDRFFHGR